MKDKKGFTLVELIAVLVILTILFIISFPSILGVLSKTNIKINDAQKLLIKDATKDYMNDRPEEYKQIEGDNYCINLINLVESNYISNKQLEDIDIESIINVEVIKEDIDIILATTCSEKNGNVDFNLLGDKEIELQSGNTYSEPGFKALDKEGNNISSLVEVSYFDSTMNKIANIDTRQSGVYIVEYKLKYEDKEYLLERIVNVVLGNKPTITHPGDSTIVNTVKSYNLLEGVSAKDSNNTNLDVSVKTNLTLGMIGNYYVIYSTKDKDGNVTKVNRNITIVESEYTFNFDSNEELNYFTIKNYGNASQSSITINNGILYQESLAFDNWKGMEFYPETVKFNSFEQLEFRMSKACINATHCKTTSQYYYAAFPFITIMFEDGYQLRYYTQQNFYWNGYSTTWWAHNLYLNRGYSVWQYFKLGESTGQTGRIGDAISYLNESYATHKIIIDSNTGTFTITNGFNNATVTIPNLTTSKIKYIDFNFHDDWYNNLFESRVDYIKIKGR